MYPIGSIVIHKRRPEFGYGIVVKSYDGDDYELPEEFAADAIAIVLWHGDENIELIETPQFHSYSELKVLSTEVGFA